MKRIILDTNFVLDCAKFRIDMFSELKRICDFPYKVFVLEGSVHELEGIAARDRTANLALALLKNVEVLKTKGEVDDILAGLADKDTIVATQDKELKRRIKTGLIIIRQKKYLVLQRYQ